MFRGSPWWIRYGDEENQRKFTVGDREIDEDFPVYMLTMAEVMASAIAGETMRQSLVMGSDPDAIRKAVMRGRREAQRQLHRYTTSYDAETRNEMIRRTLVDARSQGKFLWLCSAHGDSAEGHAPYQGAYYVDDDADAETQEYALENGLERYQWVIWSPVYMLTRPNCRHYMTAVSLEYARARTVAGALRELKMHEDVGMRGKRQTLPEKTPREEVLAEYSERLKIFTGMYRVSPTAELAGSIAKMRLLLSKV